MRDGVTRAVRAGAVVLAAALLACGQAGAAPAGVKQVFVYEVQNGRASDLAGALAGLFEGTAPGGPSAPVQTLVPTPAEIFGTPVLPAKADAARPGTIDRHFNFPGELVGGSGAIAVSSNDTANLLMVLATPGEYASLLATLTRLDRRPVQVFIEAAIVEVTLTDSLQYGLQFSYKSGQHELVLTDSKSNVIAATLPGLGYAFTGGSIQVIIDALAARGHVRVISSPKLLVLNNKPAKLVVGAAVPIATEQAIDIVTSSPAITNKILYRDTGIVLNVTPHVTHTGLVDAEISEEVSAPSPTTTSKIDSPTIQQRSISSTVTVRDGQTIALGGLIADQEIYGQSGIPWLQDIPVVGNLFRDTGSSHQRTEIIVLITPHIVANDADAAAVTDRLGHAAPAPNEVIRRETGTGIGP